MGETKKKKLYNNKISLKILIPFLIATLAIAIIGTYLIYDSTTKMGDSMAQIKLINSMELYTDYELMADFAYNWTEADKDVFYWDWENDEYSQEVLHKSDFGFVVFEYNEASGCYEVLNDLNSGVSRILAYDASILEYENCQKLNKEGSIFYTSEEMKEGILNKYYWLVVAQSEETIREGYNKRAYGVVYNVTQSLDVMRKFYFSRILLMVGPALLFALVIGIIVGKLTKRIHDASEYVANIKADSLPEEPLLVNSNDELEEMAESVNVMVQDLKDRNRMVHELSTASAIQENMLVRKFPAFPDHHEFDIYAVMDPAKEVGGDFYDLFMIDDKHLAIVIADVSDKGVPAALFMAMTKSLIKYHLPADTPERVLKSVNKFLNEGNDKFMFVTSFIGVLDLESGELSYANAGHNPPIIKLGKDGDYEYLKVKRNIVLAINPKSNYEGEKIILPHGSKILLYTDGVTEAINTKEEEYKESRLIECVKAHDDETVENVLHAVLSDIEDFRGEQAQYDDITMLMVEYF